MTKLNLVLANKFLAQEGNSNLDCLPRTAVFPMSHGGHSAHAQRGTFQECPAARLYKQVQASSSSF